MNSFGNELSTWFWNPDIWLPPNVDWDTFKEEKVINSTTVIKPENFAKFSDLWYTLPIGICFIVIRFIVEKLFLKPIGIFLGLHDRPRRQPRENHVLESHFKSKRKLSKGEASLLSRQSGLSEIQVGGNFKKKDNTAVVDTNDRLNDGSEIGEEQTCQQL